MDQIADRTTPSRTGRQPRAVSPPVAQAGRLAAVAGQLPRSVGAMNPSSVL
ncbi:hypothetical protein OG535_20120 [Kitasatospora sp. NBC_00085]|uniref:hypothetical protein n=1 Tax=unclassified Kitasatospora TaxID=2633591 RepID=UPI0032459733